MEPSPLLTVTRLATETFAAITLMTAFSYLVSESFRKLFTEPVLLNYVIRRLEIPAKPSRDGILGWTIHYAIGLAFVLAYEWFWGRNRINDGWPAALILGCISGVIGILGWMLIFRLPHKAPQVDFRSYYIQLFIAHIVFALTATGVHRLFAD